MGKVDLETENYGVSAKDSSNFDESNKSVEEKIKSFTKLLVIKLKGIDGVNTIDAEVTNINYPGLNSLTITYNGVLIPINYSSELIQDCIINPNKQFSEKIIEVICDEVKEFISTGKVPTKKNITKKVEEVDGKLVLNFYYEDGTPLIAKQN